MKYVPVIWGAVGVAAMAGTLMWATDVERNAVEMRTLAPTSHDVLTYIAPDCAHEVAVLNDLVYSNLQRQPEKLTEITQDIIAVAQIGQLCGVRLDLYDLGIVRSDRPGFGGTFTPLTMPLYGPKCFWSPATGFIGECRFVDGDDDDDDDHSDY